MSTICIRSSTASPKVMVAIAVEVRRTLAILDLRLGSVLEDARSRSRARLQHNGRTRLLRKRLDEGSHVGIGILGYVLASEGYQLDVRGLLWLHS